MKIHRASTKTVVSVAAMLLLLGATITVTQRLEPSVSRAIVCVKENGQLRMLTGGATACDASERLVEWVVEGEVTDVRAGQGLVGTREGGAINLALDPSVLETCSSCRGGRIFAGFDDGPRNMPTLDLAFGQPPAQIAKLDLPAGDYAIFAKMTLDNFSQGAPERFVFCRLEAGADFDEATADLESGPAAPIADQGIAKLGLTLQVVHHFDTPGSAILRCGDNRFIHIAPGVQYQDLKIIAVEASSISNVFLGSN